MDFADGGEINFGDEGGIDFGDEPIISENSASVETEASNSVAKGDDAQSVLLHSGFRNKFINELLELESFFTERIHEMENDHFLSSHLFQNSPTLLQMTSLENVQELLSQVVNIREQLESPALKVLYYMKDSPKYIDNIHKKVSH